MGYICLLIIFAARFVQYTFEKKGGDRITSGAATVLFIAYRCVLSVALAAVWLLFSGGGFTLPWQGLLISLVGGFSLASCSAFVLAVCTRGQIIQANFFNSAGLLVPTVAGIFLFSIPLGIWQITGIVLLFAGAALLIEKQKSDGNKKTDLLGIILLLLLFVTSGTTMLAQNMFANYLPEYDVGVFSFYCFISAAVFMALSFPIFYRPARDRESIRSLISSPRMYGIGALLAVALFAINQFATIGGLYLAPAVLYGTMTAGSTLVAVAVSALLFKKKLNVRTVIGIVSGCASVLLLNIV